MFIYIDESGTFAYPSGKRRSYACAGALTIPGRYHGQVLKSFKRLKQHWHCPGTEVKGKDLDEGQVSEVIEVLLAGHAGFHVCVADMSCYTVDIVRARKVEQADALLAHVTDQHHPDMVNWLKQLREQMRGLSDQLFMQLCVMTQLVNNHLRDVFPHFALADPPELAEFHWVLDKKDNAQTTYENLWHTLAAGFIHSRQILGPREDLILPVAGGDYSHLGRGFGYVLGTWPEHLPPPPQGVDTAKGIDVIDIGRVLRDSFTLAGSATSPGLQLADIAVNSFRRAISGRLKHSGWENLGRLMFRSGDRARHLVFFGDQQPLSLRIRDPQGCKVFAEMASVARYPGEG